MDFFKQNDEITLPPQPVPLVAENYFITKEPDTTPLPTFEGSKDKLPLPASIGRVCPHPCETACRRTKVEEPISIAYLKYFAADRVLADNPYIPTPEKSSGKRVAIIGGGPAGLTAAYFLALKGHAVKIYDAMPKMGGMLRYGIPEYRLPKKVLDAEIAEIASVGVEMINNVKICSWV